MSSYSWFHFSFLHNKHFFSDFYRFLSWPGMSESKHRGPEELTTLHWNMANILPNTYPIQARKSAWYSFPAYKYLPPWEFHLWDYSFITKRSIPLCVEDLRVSRMCTVWKQMELLTGNTLVRLWWTEVLNSVRMRLQIRTQRRES